MRIPHIQFYFKHYYIDYVFDTRSDVLAPVLISHSSYQISTAGMWTSPNLPADGAANTLICQQTPSMTPTLGLLELPNEIILMIFEHLLLPASYEGYYIPQEHPRMLVEETSWKKRRHYLRDIRRMAGTCQKLRALAGPLVWGFFYFFGPACSPKEKKSIHKRDTMHNISENKLPGSSRGSSRKTLPVWDRRLDKTYLDMSVCLSRAHVLEYVTVFKPVMPNFHLHSLRYNTPSDFHRILALANPATMPRLQRLILCSFLYDPDIFRFSSLGAHLIQYNEGAQYGLKRVNISMTIGFYQSSDLALLPKEIFPFIDILCLDLLSSLEWNIEALESNLHSLESLDIPAHMDAGDNGAAQRLATIIFNNRLSLKRLDVQDYSSIEDRFCESVVGVEWWSLPQLEALKCRGNKGLMKFFNCPEMCQSLKTLDLMFKPEDGDPDEIHIPERLCLTRLNVSDIPHGARLEGYLSFLTRLQLACPDLETLEFSGLTAADLIALAPVISQVKSFKTESLKIRDLKNWLVNSDRTCLETEVPIMPIDYLIAKILPSRLREIFLPLWRNERISYPHLKEIALQRGYTTDDAELTPSLFISREYISLTQKSTPAQLQCCDRRYGIQGGIYKPVIWDHAESMAYLSDIFWGFHDPFCLSQFCFFVYSLDDVDDVDDVYKRWTSIRDFEIKIDLQRLRELLLGQA